MILRQTESHCETNGFELPILGPRAMWTNPPEKLEWFKNPPHVRAWSHPWTHLRLIRLTLIDIDWQWSLMVYADCLWNFCSQRPSQHFSELEISSWTPGHQRPPVSYGQRLHWLHDWAVRLSSHPAAPKQDFFFGAPWIPCQMHPTGSNRIHMKRLRDFDSDPFIQVASWNQKPEHDLWRCYNMFTKLLNRKERAKIEERSMGVNVDWSNSTNLHHWKSQLPVYHSKHTASCMEAVLHLMTAPQPPWHHKDP